MSVMYETWCGDDCLDYGDFLHDERRELEQHMRRCGRLSDVPRMRVLLRWVDNVDEHGRRVWHAMYGSKGDARFLDHRIVEATVDHEDEVADPWDAVLVDVLVERRRQHATWGECDYPDGTGRPGDVERADADRARCRANASKTHNWRDILQEEVSEAFAETDLERLREELLQVAALVIHWIEALDRRRIASSDEL